jgi:S1-C subfamily serine protease
MDNPPRAKGVPSVVQPTLKLDLALKQVWRVIVDGGSGTGIAVKLDDSRVVVLTAAHVIGDSKLAVLLRGEKGLTGEVAVRMVRAKVLKTWPEWDIAILVPLYPQWVSESTSLAKGAPPLGSRLIHIGCYLGSGFPFSVSEGIASNFNVLPPETVCEGWPWKHPLDQTNIGVLGGCSGGPIFNPAGELVGIVVGSAGPPISVYVPARDIAPLLKSLVDKAPENGH